MNTKDLFHNCLWGIFFLCFFLIACNGKSNSSLSIIDIDNASLPNIFRDQQGQVWLSYVTQDNDFAKLWLSKWNETQWSDAELVSEGDNWFVNWADFPSVIKSKNKFIAHWLEKNDQGTYAYGVRFSTRSHSGEWLKEQWLHLDTSPSEHGFVSLEADENQVHAIWLDGRHMHSSSHASHDNHPKLTSLVNIKGMTLRYANINEESKVTLRQEVDSLTCDCCQTAAAMTSDGLVIAYRDRVVESLESEIRDIKVLRQSQRSGITEWIPSKNTPIDNWDIQACPVNGPVLSALDKKLALVWFTGVDEKPKIQIAFSIDSGTSFSEKIVIDDTNNLGRVGVDWLDLETVVVSWIGFEDSKSYLFYRIVKLDGSMSDKKIVSEISAGRSSGVPQLVKMDAESVLFVWTNPDEQVSIKSKIIKVH